MYQHQDPHPYPQSRQQRKSSNALGPIALILGVLTVVLAFIPAAGLVAFATALTAIFLGIIALARNSSKKGLPLTGVISGVVGALAAALLTGGLGLTADDPGPPVAQEQSVVLKVSATKRVDINYVIGESNTTERITGGDWEKTVEADRKHAVSLMVSKDAWDNVSAKITCEIIIDGQSVVKKSGTGHVFCDHWG